MSASARGRGGRAGSVRGAFGAGVAGVALLTFVLSGCTSPQDDQPSPSASSATSTPADAEGPTTAAPSPSSSEPVPTDAATEPAAEPGTVPTAAPVPLDEVADFGTGVTAELAGIDEITAEAQGPGEISGPALAIEVTVTNDSNAPVDLSLFLVNLTDGRGDPGLPMLGDPAAPVSGTLAPGRSTTGTYVFAVPEDARDSVRVEASYDTQAPTVVFTGDPADG